MGNLFPDDSVFNCTTAYTLCEKTIREGLDTNDTESDD